MPPCKHWLHPTLIGTCATMLGIPFGAVAHTVSHHPSVAQLGSADSLLIRQAGLRINRGNIISTFTGHLKRFIGDCAGEAWEGTATEDNVHFISYTTPPRQDLRVELINLTSRQTLIKKYTQKGYGSLDFKVLTLGQATGRQAVQYKIYRHPTRETVETGAFHYDLTTSTGTFQRNGEWRSELFCATTHQDELKDCPTIGGRQRLYCDGQRTETLRRETPTQLKLPAS